MQEAGHYVVRMLAAAFLGAMGPSALATDHFLAFGGGYSPQGNQVSLEKNVQFFRRMLRDTGQGHSPQHYLFADGSDPGRDLQFSEGARDEHRLYYLLAGILGKQDDIYNSYRSNELEDLNGDCSRQNIDHYFDTTACNLGPEDRLFIYYTGHGGRGEKDSPHNTTLELWDHQKMRMKEFVARLDKVRPSVPVVIVMVQCYSGGFGNVIFKEGDPAKGLSDHDRAGFFATVHDRTAAGCTPDIHEANYQEYSTYFWAAIYGRTRLGDVIEPPDYDGDGQVSLDEAHAYALIESDSIDVSIKTSDVFLRQYSSLDPARKPEEQSEPLWTAEADIGSLLPLGSACERAVIQSLSQELDLSDVQRVAAARKLGEDLEVERRKLASDRKELSQELGTIRSTLATALKSRWPELSNPWHPAVQAIVSREPAAILTVVQQHEKYPRYRQLLTDVQRIETRRLDLERKWAKCQRLIRTIENIALAQNLARIASPEIWGRYESLVRAEHRTFAPVAVSGLGSNPPRP